MSRPLSPRTLKAYRDVLQLAFFGCCCGNDDQWLEHTQDCSKIPPDNVTRTFITAATLDTRLISTWSNSALNQLKCAVRRWRIEHALTPLDEEIEKALAPRYTIAKQVYTPSEFEMSQLQKAAQLQPAPTRAAVLLMLYLGLRVEEFYSLTRKQVERGVVTKLLTFKRKGGREASLDVSKVTGLLDDLLLQQAKPTRMGATVRPRKWERVGEIYSTGEPSAQYQVIRRGVQNTFKLAGLEKASPHKLRHAFATAMNADGASVFTIQAALNHKSVATTQRYVHAGSAEVAKFMRGPGEKK